MKKIMTLSLLLASSLVYAGDDMTEEERNQLAEAMAASLANEQPQQEPGDDDDADFAAALAESARLAQQEAAERERLRREYQAAAERLILETSPTNDTRAGNLTAMKKQEHGATGSSSSVSNMNKKRPIPAPRKTAAERIAQAQQRAAEQAAADQAELDAILAPVEQDEEISNAEADRIASRLVQQAQTELQQYLKKNCRGYQGNADAATDASSSACYQEESTPATYVFDNSKVKLDPQKLALAQQYIQSLTQDEFERLQNFATSQSVSLEKVLAVYLIAQMGPITVFSARTVDNIEGTPVDNIITAYNKLQFMKKKMSQPIPTVSSSGTVATQSLTPPAQKQKPVPAPRPRSTLSPTTTPVQPTQPALATPIAAQQVVASADHTMFGILTEHKTNNMQSVTVSTPKTHTFNWQFKPYLKELATVTGDQKAVITNYIQSLSNDDYTYLVSLAHIKKTTPEYILAAYMQANADNLTLYVPVLTVSTWYLNNYPTPLQTTAASLALEKQLHASTQSSVTATVARWWKWATGQ